MEMAQDDGPGPKRSNRPLPPVETRWKKGQSGNPKGRPKLDGIEKLCRIVTRTQLKKLIPKVGPEVVFGTVDEDGVPVDAPDPVAPGLHPLVEAAVTKIAAQFSGLMTGAQKNHALIAAIKARSEFASEREWCIAMRVAAGHPIDEILREAPALEAHGDGERTAGEAEALRGDDPDGRGAPGGASAPGDGGEVEGGGGRDQSPISGSEEEPGDDD